MANHDFVMPYDARMEAWLIEQGYPHPKVGLQNRFPTKQEIFEAIASSGSLDVECAEANEFFVVKKGAKAGGEYQIRIGCSNWNRLGVSDADSITMHGGYFKTELLLLEILSHKCGQLLLYPDTGDPAVIVQTGVDVERISKLWEDSLNQQDSWKYFYESLGY